LTKYIFDIERGIYTLQYYTDIYEVPKYSNHWFWGEIIIHITWVQLQCC